MKPKFWQALCTAIFVLLLSGCATIEQSSKDPVFKSAPLNGDKLTEGYLPQVVFEGETFDYFKQSNVADMSRFLYVPSTYALGSDVSNMAEQAVAKNSSLSINRQSLTLFLDRNLNQQTLVARKALREHSYKFNKSIITNLEIIKNYLLSAVIYKPDSQHPYWEVTLSKGVNTSQCGYQEWQYNFRIAQNDFKTESVSQQLKEIEKNIIVPQRHLVAQQVWDWICYE